jgi:bifunctional non-homologous end joining protein LigD
MLPDITPIAPVRIATPFDHPDLIYEIKFDGWRCVARIENGAVQLISRKQNVYKSFAPLATAVAKLPVKNAIIDSELVVLDSEGKSVFLDLMRKRQANAILCCFDLLVCDGVDLRQQPLLERKARLRQLISSCERTLYVDHVESKGVELFKAICAKDMEGIVCKHKHAPYTSRPACWWKVLNADYSQKRGRKEMFENFRDRSRATITAT